MKTINTKKWVVPVIALALLFTGMNARAQVCGFGISTNAPISATSVVAGDNYVDGVRAEVSTVSFNGSYTIATITLNGSHTHGTFSSGDEVLLINMTGSNAGVHMNGRISGISSGTYTVDVPGTSTCSAFPSTLSTSAALQMLKINNYESFTISGGRVTCNEYDGHTGGVLCFVTVSPASPITGNLSITGGYIDVTGKGYKNQTTGWGTGGSGGTGSATSNGSGSSAPTNATFCSGGSTTTRSLTYTGGAGGTVTSSNNGGNGATTSITTITAPARSYYTVATMGDPGNYNSTNSKGGTGAKGGAAGGNGANIPGGLGGNCGSGASGASGGAGQNGNAGGNAGKSGDGAGIIIIKVGGNASCSASGKRIFAKGENGEAGSAGGAGGAAGYGGDGATPCCDGTSQVRLAGPGGNGEGGSGGNGGGGGNGGKGGVVWIAAAGTNSIASTNVSTTGGTGGAGGPAGWGYAGVPTTPDPYYDDPCGTGGCSGGSGTSCTALSPCTVRTCNPEKVMCILGTQTVGTTYQIGGNVQFLDGSSNLIGYYKKGSSTPGFDVVWAYEYDAVNYIWYQYWALLFSVNDECAGIFESLTPTSGGIGGMPAPNAGKDIDFTQTSVSGCPVGSGGSINIVFKYVESSLPVDAIAFKPTYFIDYRTPGPRVCHVMSCPPPEFVSSATGTDVDVEPPGPGTAGAGGDDNSSNSGDEQLFGSATWKMLPAALQADLEAARAVRCYPNPAAQQLTIETPELKTPCLCKVELLDITGKVVLTRQAGMDKQSRLNLDVAELARGVYTLKITGDTLGTYTRKVTLQ